MEVRETLVKVLRPCYGKPIVLITLGRLKTQKLLRYGSTDLSISLRLSYYKIFRVYSILDTRYGSQYDSIK